MSLFSVWHFVMPGLPILCVSEKFDWHVCIVWTRVYLVSNNFKFIYKRNANNVFWKEQNNNGMLMAVFPGTILMEIHPLFTFTVCFHHKPLCEFRRVVTIEIRKRYITEWKIPEADPGIPRRGTNLLFGKLFPKTPRKWRKLGRIGGAQVYVLYCLCRSATG